MRRKKKFPAFLIGFILVINTAVFAAPAIHTSASRLQHSEPNIKAFEKQLRARVLHNKKKIDASVSRTDFIYRAYRLLEAGFSSI